MENIETDKAVARIKVPQSNQSMFAKLDQIKTGLLSVETVLQANFDLLDADAHFSAAEKAEVTERLTKIAAVKATWIA